MAREQDIFEQAHGATAHQGLPVPQTSQGADMAPDQQTSTEERKHLMSMDEEIEKDLKTLTGMAKRLGLKGREAAKYVQDHMVKLGYEATNNVTYARKSSGDSKGGGFLGGIFGGGSGSDDDEL